MRSKSLFAAVLAAAAFALSFSTASVAGDIPDPVSEKITFVRPYGKDMVVGCGIYKGIQARRRSTEDEDD